MALERDGIEVCVEVASARDAVEAAEGPFGVTRCIMQNRACGTAAPCALHDAWEKGQQAILEYLQRQTLEDFVAQNPSGRFPPRG